MIERLRDVPVRKLIRAVERDGFVYRRLSGTLRQVLGATRWTDEDCRRLGLIQ